jgi:hypothetical protein
MEKLDSGLFISSSPNFLSEKADPDTILAKGRAYIGTIAVVERLRPYYDHAVNVLNIAGRQEPKSSKFAQQVTGDFSTLPPNIENLTISHLGHLQTTADGYEIAGKTDKAEEMRDVMENVYSMLKTIQLAQQMEHSGIAKHAANTTAHSKSGG